MRKRFLFYLIIMFLGCSIEDPLSICFRSKVSPTFISKIEALKMHFIECELIEDVGYDSFLIFIESKDKNRHEIATCLSEYKAEEPELGDLSVLEDCCRNISFSEESLCTELIQQGDLGKIMKLIGKRQWNKHIELRGTVMFFFYYEMTRR